LSHVGIEVTPIVELFNRGNKDVVKLCRSGGWESHSACRPRDVTGGEETEKAVCCLFRETVPAEVSDAVNKPRAFSQQGLARLLIWVELGLAVWPRFEIQVSRVKELTKDEGRGSTLKLDRIGG
jgi:hypothetical protein